MTLLLNLKGKPLEIKFNYRLVFKANKTLGSINPETKERNSDGAGTLFSKVLEQEDEALFEIIKLSAKTKVTDDEIFDAMDDYFAEFDDEETAYETIFADFKQEMIESGFFRKKIQKYIENMEKAVLFLAKKETEESKQQVEAIKELIQKMKKEILLSAVQEKD